LTYVDRKWEDPQILNFTEISVVEDDVFCGQTDALIWRSKLWLLAISRERLNRC